MLNSFLHSEIFKDSITKLKCNTSKNKNQHRKKYFSPISSDPIKELLAMPRIQQLLLDIFITFDNKLSSLYFSQRYLANKLGVSRKTVNKYIKDLVQRGYITINYNYFSTCDYYLSQFFRIPSVRKKLADSIHALKEESLSIIAGSMLHAEKIILAKVTRVKAYLAFIKSSLKRLSMVESLYTSIIGKKDKKTIKKSRWRMSHPIIEEIRTIPGVKFTVQEQINLSAFPVEAIRYARNQFVNTAFIRNPIAYFTHLCNKYCTAHNLERDLVWRNKLEESYRTNPRMFEESVFEVKQATEQYDGNETRGNLYTGQQQYSFVHQGLRNVNGNSSRTSTSEKNERKNSNELVQKSLSQSYVLTAPKRVGVRNFISEKEAYDNFKKKRKAFIGSLGSVIDNLSTTANHRQSVDSSPLPDYNDTNYSNEDDPQSNIWEFAL